MDRPINISGECISSKRASTDDLPVDQRVAFWGQYNASTLVGLKCSSFSETGFSAREDNLSLDRVRVAHIAGTQHVIERDGSMIRSVPKESVFVSLVQPHRFILEKRLQGAFRLLSQADSCGLDIAEIAYRQGFTSQAHFARAFKAHYGRTPSDVRASSVGQ
nr:helix-turn-helix domain-containing protein [Pseudomonas sp. SWRI18]